MKISEFNQMMAYVMRPEPKMQVAALDSELEKALQELNEKFGPGTVQQGTQGIPTPPKTIEREMFQNAFKNSLADGGRVNFQTGTKAAPMAAEEFKTNVLPKYVKELERWIKKNAKKYNIKTLDKFYDDAVKHFNKPPYTGNPFGKNFVSEATIKPSRLKAGENINTFRLGDYAFKNLLSLSPTTTDATSKVRYVKDMMMIELIEKDPKVKKIFVNYYNGKSLGIKELATMNRFNKEFLRGGTVNRPNLLRKYFQNLNPNLREGAKLQNEIIKYINNIPTLFSKDNLAKDLPQKATPFKGKYFNPDIGKLILGIRTLEEPNIMEQIANAAGMKYWDIYKVDAPNTVQNKMNSIAQPFFESRAVEALKKYPNYFRMSQDRKEFVITEISEAVKQDVFKVVEDGMPKSISIIRLLSNKNKKEVQNVIDFLNIDGVNKLDDVLDKKDSLGILLKIQSLVDIYDEIFYNEFNMD